MADECDSVRRREFEAKGIELRSLSNGVDGLSQFMFMVSGGDKNYLLNLQRDARCLIAWAREAKRLFAEYDSFDTQATHIAVREHFELLDCGDNGTEAPHGK